MINPFKLVTKNRFTIKCSSSFLKGEKFYSISHLKRVLYSFYPKIGDTERARCEPIRNSFRMRVRCRISITGRARLIRSHSSARFCFELNGNSN